MDFWHFSFGIMIIVLSAFGICTNLAAFIILSRKKVVFIFHGLLRLLSIFDLLVVVCSALSYGFPNVWPDYEMKAMPVISPYLIPVIHIALMSSVYCTVLISFERYIRICHICQLRSTNLVSKTNVKYYKLAVILFPIIFYVPKFFEVRWINSVVSYNVTIECSKVIMSHLQKIMKSGDDTLGELIAQPDPDLAINSLAECIGLFTDTGFWNVSLVTTKNRTFNELTPTALRRNPFYYIVYCVVLNTLVSGVLPLIALVYLNISTVRALKRMQNEFFANGTAGPVELTGARGNLEKWFSCSQWLLKFRQRGHCGHDTSKDRGHFEAETSFMNQQQHQDGQECELNDHDQGASMPDPHGIRRFHSICEEQADHFDGPSVAMRRFSRSHSRHNSSMSVDMGRTVAQVHGTTTPMPAAEGYRHKGKVSIDLTNMTSRTSLSGRNGMSMTAQTEGSSGSSSSPNLEVHSQERRLARISVWIVWLFMFCHVWKSVPTIYEVWHSDDGLNVEIWPFWLVIIEHISHTLITLNSAVNFLIYIINLKSWALLKPLVKWWPWKKKKVNVTSFNRIDVQRSRTNSTAVNLN